VTPRRAALLLHRSVGLPIAGFLVLTGLTGTTIAWNDALERVFAPSLFVLPADAAARAPLDPFALRDAAARAVPGFAVNGVDFTRLPDEPARFSVEAMPGGPDPENDEIALDPASGAVIGRRLHGDLWQGPINLMPFLYDLHDSLALGSTGTVILGLVALLWTMDCFTGAYLTFPQRARSSRLPGHWAKAWCNAWIVRWPGAGFRLLFDLHVAPSLWLWALLLVFAWSSVSFNLPSVYRPVTRLLFGLEEPARPAIAPAVPGAALLDWRAAHEAAREAMARLARERGFSVEAERLMFYDPSSRTYAYRVSSSLDPGRLGNTQITIDAVSGRTLAVSLPTGGRFGTTLTTWIEEIHTAGILGWPMKLAISGAGIAIAAISVTGVLITVRKTRRRSPSQHS
jgi:uncharacterized iron-regulated membrane protein